MNGAADWQKRGLKPVFLYTMTAGLGDLFVMGSLARSVEAAVPDSRVLFVHRNNPHTSHWGDRSGEERFFNIFSAKELRKLAARLGRARREGGTVFALQMAPGSLQGFFLYRLLKKLGLVQYVVDFNLVNADIVTPPKGDYILDLHLNQVAELTRLSLPAEHHPLTIPERLLPARRRTEGNGKVVGIHPWSRRGHLESFVWQREKWLDLVRSLLEEDPERRVVVVGRDSGFDSFCSFLKNGLGAAGERVSATPARDVPHLVESIAGLDLLVSVNTAVVHIGYGLEKAMVILCGPSLELWVPKGEKIRSVRDREALFQASDTWIDDGNFGSIQRISTEQVRAACRELLVDHE